MVPTIDLILKTWEKSNFPILADGRINIGGIRFFDNLDKFTDIKYIFLKNGNNWQLESFNQTTKPGLYPLHNPENNEGCFTLQKGFHENGWQIGQHQNNPDISHRALVAVREFPGYRDKERDGIIRYDAAHFVTNGGGINHHGTWIGHRSPEGVRTFDVNNIVIQSVGPFSEGCHVITPATDQQRFMDICVSAEKNHGQKLFSYGLLDVEDFN